MAELDRQSYAGSGAQAGAAVMDQGLRSYMMRVYNFMALGIAFTAAITLFVMSQPALFKIVAFGAGGYMKWIIFAAIFGLGMFAPKLILGGNRVLAHGAFWTYSALWGLLITPMIYYFFQTGSGNLVFRALAITAVTFGAMSLYGYTTKRDLSGWGRFLMMAAIGLLVAIVGHAIYTAVTGVHFEFFSLVISSLVVLVFSAITAWETQSIKEMYTSGGGDHSSLAIFGAFMLYGTFITMFIHILNILGIMED